MHMGDFDVVHTGLSQTEVIEVGFSYDVGRMSDEDIRAVARSFDPDVKDSDVVVRSPSTGTAFVILLEGE